MNIVNLREAMKIRKFSAAERHEILAKFAKYKQQGLVGVPNTSEYAGYENAQNINLSIDWKLTEEGENYWEDIYRRLRCFETLPYFHYGPKDPMLEFLQDPPELIF